MRATTSTSWGTMRNGIKYPYSSPVSSRLRSKHH